MVSNVVQNRSRRSEQYSTRYIKGKTKRLVKQNAKLTTVLKTFFKGKSNPEENSVNFVVTVYLHWFSIFLQDKGKEIVDALLNIGNPDSELLTQWIDVTFNLKSNENLHNLFENSKLAAMIDDLKNHHVEYDLKEFYQKLRYTFRFSFIEATRMNGIIEIYRSLLYCGAKTKLSKTFCVAVESLWKKCKFEDELSFFGDIIDETDSEHVYLQEIVEEFAGSDNLIIKNLIKEMFGGVNSKVENGKIEISGYNIILSKITKKIESFLEEYENVKNIEVRAKNEIIIDTDLELNGINLLINTIHLSIPNIVNIDLSGKNADNPQLQNTEKLPGEDGEDGKDGMAGMSSGNICILAESATNIENLNIALNGGNGSDGQNGENGIDGKDGKPVDKNKIFNKKYKIKLAAKSAANFITLGGYSLLRPLEKRGMLKKGNYFYKSVSYKNGSTNAIYYYEGEKGQPGGKGGKNGLGGKGGFIGDCSIFVDGIIVDNKIKIQARNGDDGKSGKVGKPGKSGIDGSDIAKTKKGFKNKKYGIQRKEKLDYCFTKENIEESVYVRTRDTDEFEHNCYVKIIPKEATRILLDQTKAKEENERVKESLAAKCKPINLQNAKLKQHELFQYYSMCENKNNFDSNLDHEEEKGVNRLYEYFNVKLDDDYVPLLKPVIDMITMEDIESINNTNEGWEKLYGKSANFSITDKLITSDKTPTNNLLFKDKITYYCTTRMNGPEISYCNGKNELLEEMIKNIGGLLLHQPEMLAHKINDIVINGPREYLKEKFNLFSFECFNRTIAMLNAYQLTTLEGCLTDSAVLNFMIETMFFTKTTIADGYIFPFILLSTRQSQWTDEFFIVNAEVQFNLSMNEIILMRKKLKKIKDKNLKILFCTKLHQKTAENTINLDETFQIFKHLKKSVCFYPYLKDAPLNAWLKICTDIKVISETTVLPDEINVLSRNFQFFYTKLLEQFGAKTVKPLTQNFIKLTKCMDENKLGIFVQRICEKDYSNFSLKEIFQVAIMKEPAKQYTRLMEDENSEKVIEGFLQKTNTKFHEEKSKQVFLNAAAKSVNQFEEMPDFEDLETNICDYDTFKSHLPNDCENAKAMYLQYLLKIVDKMIKKLRGYHLRDTQKLAILCALNSEESDPYY